MKIMAGVFWAHGGVLLGTLLDHNDTVIAERCCDTLERLRIGHIRPWVSPQHVMMIHDNASPHTDDRTWD